MARFVAALGRANWIETNAARGPAQEIMTAYMDGLRKRGNKPLRDWDK